MAQFHKYLITETVEVLRQVALGVLHCLQTSKVGSLGFNCRNFVSSQSCDPQFFQSFNHDSSVRGTADGM